VRRALTLLLALLALAPAAHAAEPQDIDATAAIVVNPQTGDVVYEKDADGRHAIASTTKLMTALLTLEEAELDETVTAPRYGAAPGESILGLVPGEEITVADLLRALLMASANDAAVALADHVAGGVPAFVRMMNRRAQELGLDDTHYANPIGLDQPGNYSTARDLATLATELRKNVFFRRTVNSPEFALRSGGRPRTIKNRNTLLDAYRWVNGIKTGFTRDAGYVLVASGRKRDVNMLSVVIGAPSESERNNESAELLNYGLRRYEVETVISADRPIENVPIASRPGAELPVVADARVREARRKNERFETDIYLPDEVEGPHDAGDKVGRLVVTLRGRPVASVDLRAALDVPKASAARRIQDVLTQPWILIVLGAVLVAVALLAYRRPSTHSRPTEEPA
jgi:D-alanyl-D-alanine carboxypeptidase (penicillin-binding protein 5/6)